MGLAQTGTGKTTAFGPPQTSERFGAGSDTRIGQSDCRVAAYLDGTHTTQTTLVVGGVNSNTQINKKIKPGADLLMVATPGRLIDLMERKSLILSETSFLVLPVDEADLMLNMLGFLPSLRKIEKTLPRERQTMLFSAAMSKNMNGSQIPVARWVR
jgi:ATP-dependent RNA helicase RhlE